jgi:hypothetical protein
VGGRACPLEDKPSGEQECNSFLCTTTTPGAPMSTPTAVTTSRTISASATTSEREQSRPTSGWNVADISRREDVMVNDVPKRNGQNVADATAMPSASTSASREVARGDSNVVRPTILELYRKEFSTSPAEPSATAAVDSETTAPPTTTSPTTKFVALYKWMALFWSEVGWDTFVSEN